MILVDANVWIDHLRGHDPLLDDLCQTDQVLIHPYTIAEIGLGSLSNRDLVISQLEQLPLATVEHHDDVMALIANNNVAGTGVGYVDCHLLTSAVITGNKVWTRDKRLNAIAVRLQVSYDPN